MQKKICFLLVCLFLTGCSSTKTELFVENTEENQAMLEINKIQLPLEQDCSVGSYCVDGDTVYYSVYMSGGDYGANPDTKFDDSMTYLSDPYNYRNEVNVIRKEDHSVEQIKTDRFFNYGLLGNYLIFNKSDRITAYDLLSGEETELLKAEQDSFEWMFCRGETLCTKNGNEIYVISLE